MVSNGQTPLASFLAQHRTQLEGTGVPQVKLRRFDKHNRIPVTILRIPLQIYWPTLLNKLEKQQFDAGSAFSILQVWKYTADREGTVMQSITCPEDMVLKYSYVRPLNIYRDGPQVEYEEGEREDGDPDFVVETTLKLTQEEPEHIYLVDHAWTF